MAKGQISKEKVTEQILAAFPNSFQYDKEIRIPMIEDGNEIQIKVTLTCAKTNVENGSDTAVPGAEKTAPDTGSWVPGGGFDEISNSEPAPAIKASNDEKSAVSDLMASLGL